MADIAPTTRRTALATMAGVALTAIPLPADAAAPFKPEPTWLGRRYLRYAALVRLLWSRPEDEYSPRYIRFLELNNRYLAELKRVREEILARPVESVSDAVDRIILAAGAVNDDHEEVIPPLAGVLAAAGITPEECSEQADWPDDWHVEA
jgi:hypothetical protein